MHDEVKKLKEKYKIATLPSDCEYKLDEHNPRIRSKTLGKVSALIDAQSEIEGAEYSQVTLADIFIEKVGGHNVEKTT